MTEAELISVLLDTANQLIAIGLEKISHEDPEKHAAIVEFSNAGAVPKVTITTFPNATNISFLLTAGEGGIHVFEYRLQRAQSSKHLSLISAH